ncbi:MAG: hypothetical protein L3J67_01605 [Hyphomicrobiaceae bacterium]|nr:hypothetical protein [Hyphomicrobiaceae bacterium]
MSFEDLQAEISLLLTQMENQPEDPHELHELVREKINEMRAFGLPIPENLLKFEKELGASFLSDDEDANEGRSKDEG